MLACTQTLCPAAYFDEIRLARWYVSDGSPVKQGELVAELSGIRRLENFGNQTACQDSAEIATLDLVADSNGVLRHLIPLNAVVVARAIARSSGLKC